MPSGILFSPENVSLTATIFPNAIWVKTLAVFLFVITVEAGDDTGPFVGLTPIEPSIQPFSGVPGLASTWPATVISWPLYFPVVACACRPDTPLESVTALRGFSSQTVKQATSTSSG